MSSLMRRGIRGISTYDRALRRALRVFRRSTRSRGLEVVGGRAPFLFLGFLGAGGFRGMVVVVHKGVDEMIVRR